MDTQYLSSDEEGQAKKRKIQRACDMCRRKKIRCDGVQNYGGTCSNCRTYGIECTYVEQAKKRGPPKAYIEGLENRVEKMERLIRQLMPDEDLEKYLDSFSINRETWSINGFKGEPSHTFPTSTEQRTLPEEDAFLFPDNLNMMFVEPCEEYRYFGQSSAAMLTQTALNLKDENTSRRPSSSYHRAESEYQRALEREQQIMSFPNPVYDFPEDDLLPELVNIYFREVNIYIPLLHRPTFDRLLAAGQHRRDELFGAILLLVCAIAARYTDDPRVLLDDSDSGLS
ncbi:Gypsy retrotransposon integrase-like protein 1, partial [Marasmius crinis-equi]